MLQLPGLNKWRDKVALVTGASSGIGWATCEVLAQQGAFGYFCEVVVNTKIQRWTANIIWQRLGHVQSPCPARCVWLFL